jgi:hypothetical protein
VAVAVGSVVGVTVEVGSKASSEAAGCSASESGGFWYDGKLQLAMRTHPKMIPIMDERRIIRVRAEDFIDMAGLLVKGEIASLLKKPTMRITPLDLLR